MWVKIVPPICAAAGAILLCLCPVASFAGTINLQASGDIFSAPLRAPARSGVQLESDSFRNGLPPQIQDTLTVNQLAGPYDFSSFQMSNGHALEEFVSLREYVTAVSASDRGILALDSVFSRLLDQNPPTYIPPEARNEFQMALIAFFAFALGYVGYCKRRLLAFVYYGLRSASAESSLRRRSNLTQGRHRKALTSIPSDPRRQAAWLRHLYESWR
jgi:hypothetical protein